MFARPTLLAAAGLTAATALTGCATTTATSTTVAAPVVTGTAVPVAATVASPATPTSKAPTLTNAGTTWPSVVGSLITYGQWLLANPNPALAGAITVPGCAANNALTAELQTFVDENNYVQPTAPALTRITGPTGAIGGQVTVDIDVNRGNEPIYHRSAAGNTTRETSELAALAPTTLSITLNRGADNRWRFCTVTDDINDPDEDALTHLL